MKGTCIKTLYLIRHAKSDWKDPTTSDFERGLTKRGCKDLNMMGSYLKLRGIVPDLVIASCSLRTQITADAIADNIGFEGQRDYLQELYLTSPETLKETLMLQENTFDTIMVVGHNPQMTDVVNMVVDEHITKMPTLGIVAINFDIDEWSQLEDTQGKIDFFIFPKQFKYYMPKQIRAVLNRS